MDQALPQGYVWIRSCQKAKHRLGPATGLDMDQALPQVYTYIRHKIDEDTHATHDRMGIAA
jgi:hypothetical protein